MRILVLNTGSSSVKYKLFQMPAAEVLRHGAVERIGQPEAGVGDHQQALERVFEELHAEGVLSARTPLAAIGHRVVHGGMHFDQPVVADAAVMRALREIEPLAPLHNPAARAGIEAAARLHPDLPQVLVFDTAFFQTLTPAASRYALPRWCYEELAIRRYGFHGTSHQYVSRQAAALLERPLEALRIITLHLGNGASAAAILGGTAIDTSMGLTPLEGLVMGTRSGDLDPAAVALLQRSTGRSADEVEQLLNRESGLKGVSGESDMREVLRREAEGDSDAALAVEMYVRRIQKYVGAYFALLGGLDALVFTAGVGEQSAAIRARVCQPLEHLGIALDPRKNEAAGRAGRNLARPGGAVATLVVPTDEERAIAEAVADRMAGA